MIVTASISVPFSCEQMFDLAADIERYPEFLKGWTSARVLERAGDTWMVEQVMGVGPTRLRFASTAVLQRPLRIEVSSQEPPFRHYRLCWNIAPLGSGCRIDVRAEFELKSGLLQRLINPIVRAAIQDAVVAFETRARLLYGDPAHG